LSALYKSIHTGNTSIQVASESGANLLEFALSGDIVAIVKNHMVHDTSSTNEKIYLSASRIQQFIFDNLKKKFCSIAHADILKSAEKHYKELSHNPSTLKDKLALMLTIQLEPMRDKNGGDKYQVKIPFSALSELGKPKGSSFVGRKSLYKQATLNEAHRIAFMHVAAHY
jgi:hypothetical protein